jgi:hypothetical protein
VDLDLSPDELADPIVSGGLFALGTPVGPAVIGPTVTADPFFVHIDAASGP